MISCLALLVIQAAGAGRFQAVSENGRWWLQGPHGPMWSLGVDCVDSGDPPEKIKPDNPAYSGVKLFGSEEKWAQQTLPQLKSWGFNTLGGWCDVDTLRKFGGAAMMPYTVVLHLGAYDQAPWHDLFSPEMEKAMDGAARDQIPKYRDDPNLVGYFTDNELGWWDDTLFTSYLGMDGSTPGHRRLIELLRSHYRNDFGLLKKDWITDLTGFDGVKKMWLRPGGNGRRVIKEWAGVAAGHYYKLAHDLVRKYDKTHLILGDRYCQYYSLPVVEASRPYIDVASANYGADWNDGSTDHFFLDTLHQITDKPVLISEFYMCAKQNRSGDRNNSDGFPVVDTQQERADAFGNYVKRLAEKPYVIGAHWFQYTDEPGKGRGDGEDYNMGLVDIDGGPYEELTGVAKALPISKLHREGAPHMQLGSPPAPSSPKEGLKAWDRDRGWIWPESKEPVADLYTCWTSEGLYVGLYCMDYGDPSLYQGGRVPESERSFLNVELPGGKTATIRYGGKQPLTISGVEGVSATADDGLKTTVVTFIPAGLLGHQQLRAGWRVSIDATACTHGRAETMVWHSEIQLLK